MLSPIRVIQYPGITPQTDDMAKVVASRAQQGAAIPAYGMEAVNKAALGTQAASKNLSDAQYAPMNNMETIGNTLQSMLKDKDSQANFANAYKGISNWFGSGPTAATVTNHGS